MVRKKEDKLQGERGLRGVQSAGRKKSLKKMGGIEREEGQVCFLINITRGRMDLLKKLEETVLEANLGGGAEDKKMTKGNFKRASSFFGHKRGEAGLLYMGAV